MANSPIDTEIDQILDWEDGNVDYDDDSNIEYINSMNEYSSRNWAAVTDNMTGIFGLPYQWSPQVDPVLYSSTTDESSAGRVGRKYAEKILSVMPVIFFTPGEPAFMSGQNVKNKRSMASKMLSALSDGGSDKDWPDDDEGRYYSFRYNYADYKEYANAALRATLFYMGLSDTQIPIPGTNKTHVKGSRLNIDDFMNTSLTKLLGTYHSLPFYLDAETSISEDFSNSTTESMLAQTANGFSSTAREIQFIMGKDDTGSLANSLKNVSTDLASNLGSALGDLSEAFTGKNMLSNVLNEVTTIVQGGKIIFPEIWSDSDYSKSYNITLKLRSPDPDPISIFLNVYMPIILLITLASPKQLNNGSNSYQAPFLVRASYKSIFNVDMGIIESLSITRGGEDRWNVLGMPYTADVSITIKDLYGSMFISNGMGLINNTAQMDYLATLSGIDLNEYEPTRIYKLATMIATNKVMDIPSRMWGGIKQSISRLGARMIPSDNTAIGG